MSRSAEPTSTFGEGAQLDPFRAIESFISGTSLSPDGAQSMVSRATNELRRKTITESKEEDGKETTTTKTIVEKETDMQRREREQAEARNEILKQIQDLERQYTKFEDFRRGAEAVLATYKAQVDFSTNETVNQIIARKEGEALRNATARAEALIRDDRANGSFTGSGNVDQIATELIGRLDIAADQMIGNNPELRAQMMNDQALNNFVEQTAQEIAGENALVSLERKSAEQLLQVDLREYIPVYLRDVMDKIPGYLEFAGQEAGKKMNNATRLRFLRLLKGLGIASTSAAAIALGGGALTFAFISAAAGGSMAFGGRKANGWNPFGNLSEQRARLADEAGRDIDRVEQYQQRQERAIRDGIQRMLAARGVTDLTPLRDRIDAIAGAV